MSTLIQNSDFLGAFTRGLKDFVRPLIDELHKVQMISEISEIDHVCYRVADLTQYEHMKMRLGEFGVLLTEAPINGRPIATFRLHNSVQVTPKIAVKVVELPAPKPGRPYEEGFEHIEAVVLGGLESFMEKHGSIRFDVNNFHAPRNRDISVCFPTGLVKFHELSLERIIEIEKKTCASKG